MSKFLDAGSPARHDALCVNCGSLERHRFVWMYFNQNTDLFTRKNPSMLHIAPEECFTKSLQNRLGGKYLTADLFSDDVMVKMDITDIQYPDETFDAVYCSHVLEHVQNDRKAMREFFRVVKKGGWAVLLVPISADKTIEYPNVTDPAQRLALYGQEDHVRRYGPDYIDRLRESGFAVIKVTPDEYMKESDRVLYGITDESGDIYYCTK
ncbi:MAG: methyltransferase domain-containing protein [Bacteroidota bacterium]